VEAWPEARTPQRNRPDLMAAPKSFFLTPEIHEYVVAHGTPPDAVQQALIAETAELPMAMMQISPEQGAFMTLLVRALGVRQAVEVGTFTGYSALAIARGLPDDGHLLCCDVSEEWTSVGRRAWAEAGVDDRIELVIAPAADTLRALPDEEYIDLAFIDADKPSYATYYEELLRRLTPNGLILVDNTLWSGAIVDPKVHDESTVALRAFNDMVAADDRVDSALLTIGDGLTLLRKR
jgi:caffeoyl-CoA O-methyltransferase